MSGKPENLGHFEWTGNLPEVSQKFTESGTLWAKMSGHSECATREHFRRTVLVRFEFYWLGTSKSHWLGNHKEHFEWTTWEHHGYFLWENSRFTHRLPNWDTVVTWPGKLGTHWAVLSEWATREHCGYFIWENFRFPHGLPNRDIAITWSGTLWMYWAFPALGTLQLDWLGKF